MRVWVREGKGEKVMKKKEIMYFVLIGIATALLYFGMAAFWVTVFYTNNIVAMRIQSFSSMIMTGVIVYFIFKPIIKKKLKSALMFDSTIIIAILVANVFRAAVTEFSLAYISLMIATLYLLLEEE
jgi:hypothetical protein